MGLFKFNLKTEIEINESIPYLIYLAEREPWLVLSQDISYKEKKKKLKITIGLYNVLLLLLILFVFLLVLFSGGITIGQMAPPPIYIGNVYGLSVTTESFIVTEDGFFSASLKVPVYNKSMLSGRLSVRNIVFVPVSANFVCSPNKFNNNIFSHSILDKNMSNGFIFPLNPKYPLENENVIVVKKAKLETEDVNLRNLETSLGRYGEVESKLGAWLPPGKNEFNIAVKGVIDIKRANRILNHQIGSNCGNGSVKYFAVDTKLDFNMRYFLGSISSVQQDIGYVLFPACSN
ncbi:hypothetical protein HWI79_3316 [Cryptosporidium felis]|nr:hypothetical protein HWI79_3316 [Cryptosporidium felis]